jgi:hypothetical protein
MHRNRADSKNFRTKDWSIFHAFVVYPGKPAGTTREEVRAYEWENVRATC